MSLNAALSSAATGLMAAGRAAQTISDNVANALTPGYATRSVERESVAMGGVAITGISRRETLAIITDRRISDAALGAATTRGGAMDALSAAVGTAGDPASLTGRFAALSARLIEAQSRPDSDLRLSNLHNALDDLVSHINAIGDAVQDQRLGADRAIAEGVDLLNTTLQQIHDLNVDIVSADAQGRDIHALLDQRRLAIDRIAELVPIRQIPRDGNRVALMTDTGKVLLDTRPATVSFTATNGMSPAMALGAPLSGLTIDGRPIDTADPGGPIAGGRLSALFALRDDALPTAQAQVDSIARDLIERFAADSVDPSTPPGAPGLLTDDGAALTAAIAPGLAQRLSVNAAVDPARGGETFRLRDGLAAATPGQAADASVLNALYDALTARSVPSDTALTGSTLDAGGLLDTLQSTAGANALTAEIEMTRRRSANGILAQAEQAEGVNTDDEMRNLLLVEQAYAANARVLEVANAMMQRLLEI